VSIDLGDITDAVSHATCDTAFDLRAAAILTATAGGTTARHVAKFRPHAVIMAATPNPTVERQMRLTWGIIPVHSRRAATTDQIVHDLLDLAIRNEIAKERDRVVITAGVATNMPGKTNMMTVEEIRKPREPAR
jgi:pyruvate kinase